MFPRGGGGSGASFPVVNAVTAGLVPPPGNASLDYGIPINAAYQSLTALGFHVGLPAGNYYCNTQILMNLDYGGIVGAAPARRSPALTQIFATNSLAASGPLILQSSGVPATPLHGPYLANLELTCPLTSGWTQAAVGLQRISVVAGITSWVIFKGWCRPFNEDVDPNDTGTGADQSLQDHLAFIYPETDGATAYGPRVGCTLNNSGGHLTVSCDTHFLRWIDPYFEFAGGGNQQYGMYFGLCDTAIVDGFINTNSSNGTNINIVQFDYSFGELFNLNFSAFPSEVTFVNSGFNTLTGSPTLIGSIGTPANNAYPNRFLNTIYENIGGIPNTTTIPNVIAPWNEPGPLITDGSTTALNFSLPAVGSYPVTKVNNNLYPIDVYLTAQDTGTTFEIPGMSAAVAVPNGQTVTIRIPANAACIFNCSTTKPKATAAFADFY